MSMTKTKIKSKTSSNVVCAILITRERGKIMFNCICSEAHEKHDATSHWKREHYGMIALLPLIPAALIYPHPVLDTVMVTAMALHVHWFVCSCIKVFYVFCVCFCLFHNVCILYFCHFSLCCMKCLYVYYNKSNQSTSKPAPN